MGKLSVREKKLLYLLLLIVGFIFWYKAFVGTLLPEYKSLANILKENPSLSKEIMDLEKTKELVSRNLKESEQELISIQQKYPQAVGLLLSSIGRQALGRVDILKAEHISVEDEDFYRIAIIEIKIKGTMPTILEYLKDLETRSGIKIQESSFNYIKDKTNQVEAELLIEQAFVPNTKGKDLPEPSIFYSPLLPNADLILGETFIYEEGEQKIEGKLEVADELSDLNLSSYTFPIL